ncbi:MAG: hypothetical protein ACYCUM_10925 [Solirubrobacteraceae bacterium]
MPIRPGESTQEAGARLERLVDQSLVDWRERRTWHRRQVMDARSGALDLPGRSWRDRPAIDRDDGVFLAGDMVAAPGLLSEVAWASAIEASRLVTGSASSSGASNGAAGPARAALHRRARRVERSGGHSYSSYR